MRKPKDSTISHVSDIEERRQHKRYKINDTEIHVKMALADEVNIHDISLGGHIVQDR